VDAEVGGQVDWHAEDHEQTRNPHRTGAAWTLRTVAAILANPRYTGRQVWNRQRTDFDLADPTKTTLGHKQVQR
jgi:site-specific DNA recombinase